MNLWNIKDLKGPPVTTYKSSSPPEIFKLRKHFKDALYYFNHQEILNREAALLSRCIYRVKMKFRSDKGLKAMEKLNRTLLQFKYLDLYSMLDDFVSLLPKSDDGMYLPSRNMLDYILVRLQGVTYLMYRATDIAQIVADNMGSRVCIGHVWKVAVIILAAVSRIWFICRDIVKYCCNFYKNIKPMRNILINIGNSWLPENYDLPEYLESWLDINWINEQKFTNFEQVKTKSSIQDLLNVGECQDSNSVKHEKQEISDSNKKYTSKEVGSRLSAFNLLTQNDDFGEIIYESSLKITESGESIINLSSSSEDETIGSCTSNDRVKKKADVRAHIEETTPPSLTSSVHLKSQKDKNIEIKTSNDDCFMHKRKLSRKLSLTKKRRVNPNGEEPIGNENRLEAIKSIYTALETTDQQIINQDNTTKIILMNNNSVKKHKKKPSPTSMIDKIDSIKKLKHFMFSLTSPDLSKSFKKIDKLQLEMLKKLIRKYMKKTEKNIITDSECLLQAKQVLKATFI